jgi:ribosome-binding protein aMBF1 (putative translation factor)
MISRNQLHAIVVVIVLSVIIGCVSQDAYDSVVAELQSERQQVKREREQLSQQRISEQTKMAALQKENSRLHQMYDEAVQKLSTLEMVSKAELVSKLEATQLEVIDKQEKAYYKGMVDVLSSLEIRGVPSKKGWLFITNFYTIDVKLLDHIAFSQTIETKAEMNPVTDSLAKLANLA